MELIITKDIDEMSREFATWMSDLIQLTLKKKKSFSLVLSGGTTPQKLFQLLATKKYRKKIEWDRIQIFWGDERVVDFSDNRNNAKMAFDNFLSIVPVKKDQVHIIDTTKTPDTAAEEYEKLLRQFFPGTGETFDLVILGLGDNAHTLSLFPGYEVVLEKKHWVRAFYLEEQKMYRVTLTAPVINAARNIVFLVSGPAKAPALQHVLEDTYDPWRNPAQVIRPERGRLFWWVDEAAAQNLTNTNMSFSTI